MFATDKNIDTLQDLFLELKKYARLEGEYFSMQLVQKLTVLLSTLILVFVLLILGIMVLFYLSFTLAYVLAPSVGGLAASYGIITACILLLIVVIAALRERLIVRPMVHFLARLFLNDVSATTDEKIAAKRREAEESMERMQVQAQELFVAEPAPEGVEGLFRHVQTGIAIYDGVRTGIKIMRRVQAVFGKRRKKKRK